MKYTFIFFLAVVLSVQSCSNGQTPNNTTTLTATEFAAKIKELPDAPLVDVRTPEEYSKGHLQNAKNIDWNGNTFEEKIASLDKSQPVLVYCLSGGRSAQAAKQMRSEGFKEVYELKGGIMKWRAASLPETIEKSTEGMNSRQFDELLDSDKLILVDFYADWCEPCKKMKPYLEEISGEMSEKVSVIRINADDNRELCKELKIDALPVLQLYKSKNLIWANTGYLDKADIVKQLQ